MGKRALYYSWLSEESQMLESSEQRVSHIKCNCFSCAEFDFSYHSLSRPSELRVGFRQMLFGMNGRELWQRRRGDVIKKEGLVVYSQSGNGAHTLCRNYLLLPDQLLWSHNVHRREVADEGRSRSEEIVERRPDEGFWDKVWFWGCKDGETSHSLLLLLIWQRSFVHIIWPTKIVHITFTFVQMVGPTKRAKLSLSLLFQWNPFW